MRIRIVYVLLCLLTLSYERILSNVYQNDLHTRKHILCNLKFKRDISVRLLFDGIMGLCSLMLKKRCFCKTIILRKNGGM